MSQRNPWTPEQEQRLREAWPDYRPLAAEFGRTLIAVRARARQLKLPPMIVQRAYTPEELEAIRQRYPNEGAVELAREQGRKAAYVVAVALRLGLTYRRRWTPEEDRELLRLHRERTPYAQIGKALDRSICAVAKRIADHGLATPQRSDRDKRRRKLRALHEPSNSGCEQRWARERLALGEHGWPPDLNPKEVKILNLIAERGPMTRRKLSEAVGEPRSDNVRYQLRTHGGRSAVARLLARRLLVRVMVQGEGRRRASVYAIPLDAQQQRGTWQSVADFNTPIASRGRRRRRAATPIDTTLPRAASSLHELMELRRRMQARLDQINRELALIEGRRHP